MWLMDALALSDGTVSGLGKVLAERMPPTEEMPVWCKHKRKEEMEEIMTRVVKDAYEGLMKVRDYVETETSKGRALAEIQEEVRPFLEANTPSSDTPTSNSDQEAQHEGSEREGTSYLASVLQARRSNAPAAQPSRRPLRALPKATELREPLMLVGSINDWSLDEAAQHFTFNFDGPPDSSFQESKLRTAVPEKGLRFQILSVKRGPKWRMTPCTQTGKLQEGERRSVPATIVRDKVGKMTPNSFENSFEIRGTGVQMIVDIWVAKSAETDCKVWFVGLD